MVYQAKTRVPGRTVRETGCLGVTEAGGGTRLGGKMPPRPYSLPAAARNMGLGSWVGGGDTYSLLFHLQKLSFFVL